MKAKKKLGMIIDIAMTIGLLLCMSYLMIGEALHEWIGMAMLLLFIVHHFLNWRWFITFWKGKYTIQRWLQTLVDLALLVCMLGLMISGIMMSRHVIPFISIQGNMSFARTMHLLSSYWGFVLMSVHLGFHWDMILTNMKYKITAKFHHSMWSILLTLTGVLWAIYGAYTFFKLDLISYMLLQNEFVFFDLNQPLIEFLMEYLAMMGFWCWAAYDLKIVCVMAHQKRQRRKAK